VPFLLFEKALEGLFSNPNSEFYRRAVDILGETCAAIITDDEFDRK
jgi:hypothetical protein